MKKSMSTLLIVACLVLFIRVSLSEKVTILHFSDTHSNLSPGGPRNQDLVGQVGGIAKAATAIGMARIENPNSILLHSGDLFIGDLFFNKYFGAAELQLMVALGFDAMTLGNHEFDLTPDVLTLALSNGFSEGSFPILSANYTDGDVPELEPLRQFIKGNVIKEFAEVKVGIFGLTTPATNMLSQPAPAEISENIVTIAFQKIAELQSLECDYIILLSHLGIELDQIIAANVTGIDLILGGHDHLSMTEPLEVNGVKILHCGEFYRSFGKLEIDFTDGDVKSFEYSLVPLDENVPEEPTTKAAVEGLIAGIEETYESFYTVEMGIVAEKFSECQRDLMEYGEHDTPVGNLVCEAFLEKYPEADIAIQAGGSTSQPLYKGPIVASDIYRMISYGFNTDNGLGYRMATFEISGGALEAALNFTLSDIEGEDEFFIQTAGMKYEYSTDLPVGERLHKAWIGDTELEPTKMYTVVSNEFVPMILLALGIPYESEDVKTGVSEFQVVMEYVVAEYSNQGKPLTPFTDGRIKNVIIDGVEEDNEKYHHGANDLKIWPNPAGELINFKVSIDNPGNYSFKVYDVLGSVVTTVNSGFLVLGEHDFQFDSSALANGLYTCVLHSPEFAVTEKVIITK